MTRSRVSWDTSAYPLRARLTVPIETPLIRANCRMVTLSSLISENGFVTVPAAVSTLWARLSSRAVYYVSSLSAKLPRRLSRRSVSSPSANEPFSSSRGSVSSPSANEPSCSSCGRVSSPRAKSPPSGPRSMGPPLVARSVNLADYLQLVGGGVQAPDAILGHGHDVLDAHAEAVRQVDAGLDRERHPRLER